MKLGELFIELGITGDITPLKKALSGMDSAKLKTKLLAQAKKELKNATSKEAREQIKSTYRQKLNTLAVMENVSAIGTLLKTAAKIGGVLAGVTIAFDRFNNSLLKSNQLFINFTNQTGMSITRLNKLAGVAKLSGMGLSIEQVANDLTNLEQRIFKLGLTGEGSGIFAQLGMNPMGMNSDQFIGVLRQRMRGLSEVQKTYILDQLGLSREWLNVLNLSNKEYADLLKQSQELQLTEQERKELAKYTALQQKNNMRWELAKQRFLKATMPLILKIMDVTSKIALNISNALGNEKTLSIVKDITALFSIISIHALRTNKILMPIIKGLLKLLGIGALFGGVKGAATASKGLWGRLAGLFGVKQAGKFFAKRGATMAAAAGTAAIPGVGPIVATLLEIGLGIWTIWDLLKIFFGKQDKEDQEENTTPPIDDGAWRYQYQNINSNMINHFHNNPVPQQVVIDNLNDAVNKYLAGTKR